jgi:uncharacterized protein YndB with AHSA1/START domain
MIRFTIETEINRPVADVFAYVTDSSKLSTWQKNTVSVVEEGDGPFGVGTRLHEVHRAPGGKELATVVEVSEFELNRSLGLRMIEGPLPIHADVSFEPTSDGTRVLFTAHGEPRGPMRLLQPVLGRTLQRGLKEHCETLKAVLEDE